MFAVIAVLTIAVLTRAFRSIVLAVKAVMLNLVSMAAAFGVITWFWQQGHGSSFVFRDPSHRRDHVLDPADGVRVPVLVCGLAHMQLAEQQRRRNR